MTRRYKHAVAVLVLVVGFAHSAPASNPVGDFFKRLGRTLSKPHATPSRQTSRKNNVKRAGTNTAASPAPPVADDQAAPQPAETPAAVAQATPSPAQPTTRAASSAPQSSGSRDLPYAVPVANRPGFVTSPYAPTRGYVDVRGFPSGTEVKDPYTGKLFRTP